ncbi:hypothetical protein B296_00022159 [Ensete ventricosum]|uniref:Uncharacterized protein n=1 Tax=Ensete ventricosum TaxID=4639 RepID=A0A427AUR2_ENSVE|nr:hypothetical protein B296_00022159 [Ensete ventricosum]
MIKCFKISQVPRIKNYKGDALVKSISADTPNGDPPTLASVYGLMVAAIEKATSTTHSDWREEILRYKKDATLLTDKEVAQ